MGRSILNNIIHLFYSTILANLLQAVSLIVLANFFNAQHYGMFSVAIAVTFVMLFFTDLGLSNTFLREGAKDGADLEKILSSYIKNKDDSTYSYFYNRLYCYSLYVCG